MRPPDPEGVVFRAGRPEDARPVAALLNAVALDEVGRADTTVQEVESRWQAPGTDPAKDVVIAECAGRIVGYLWVASTGERPCTAVRIDGYVHPGWRGRGIGSALLARGEDRARELAGPASPGRPVRAFHGVWHGSAGTELLRSRGFERSRLFFHMTADLADPPPPATWPQGIEARTAGTPEDERALHAAIEEAFADHWEHTPQPFESWLHEHRSAVGADPSLWFMAVDGDEVVGGAVCHSTTTEDPGSAWVEHLGVRRRWRRRGVALALLRHAFGEFHRRGISRAGLMVDAESQTGATRLYERVGMRVLRRIDVFTKQLQPRGPGVTPAG